jgi:large subunit ribosomal protein L13
MQYTIDATNKSLGRLASEVAILLMGKNSTAYARNAVIDATVTVQNASKLKIPAPRFTEKTYKRYSGYPGGLKELTMEHVIAKKGYSEIVTIAVKGMLPDNKLKKEMMKHLTVTE